MNIEKLHLENFMAVGEATLHLSNKGLLLVQGENEDDTSQDSNGAGKSSIVDALCWGIYGRTARGEDGDLVVNETAGNNTLVEVTLTEGNECYKIVRYRKHKVGKNTLLVKKLDAKTMAETADLSKGTNKETQVLVDSIIGSSYDVFRSSVYAGQEDQIDLPAMTDKFLKSVVEEAAGIDLLQKASVIANDRHRSAKNKVSDLSFTIDNVKNDIEQGKLSLKSANEKLDAHEVERAQKLDNFDGTLKAQQERLVKAVGELKAVDIQSKLDSLNQITEAIGRTDAEREKHGELTQTVTKTASEDAIALSKVTATADQIRKLQADLANASSQVGKPCSSCGKLTEAKDVSAIEQSIKDKIGEGMLQVAEDKKQLLEVRERAEKARVELSTHKASMTDISKATQAQSALKDEIHAYETQKAALVSDKDKLEQSKNRREELANAPNPHQSLVTKCFDQVQKSEALLAEKESEMEKATAAEEIARYAAEVYSPVGVRAHILDTVTPFLNQRTAHYLSTLSDGNLSAVWNTLSRTAKGELRERFKIEVSSLKGGKSFKSLSGGEKRKVRLATNLALQDLVSSRAAKPLSIYVGDEIDHALDKSGLERLMQLLEQRAKSQGTVLVISHNELSDWIREQIIVRKKNGISTIDAGVAA